jgi:hypothetical protein
MTKIKSVTKQDFLKCFADYRAAFPDWDVKQQVILARAHGPIEQHIAFEALRANSYRPAYRPSCSIQVLGAGIGFQLLFSFLDIKHREVYPRDHEAKFPNVLKAMEEQFQPCIRKPLDVADVIQLAEEQVEAGGAGNIQYCSGLATLNAHAGNKERALFWCTQVEEQLNHLGREPADWELQGAKYARQLAEAIRAGEQRAFLRTACSGPAA